MTRYQSPLIARIMNWACGYRPWDIDEWNEDQREQERQRLDNEEQGLRIELLRRLAQSNARICLSCDLSGECHAFDSPKQVCELCEHHEPLTVEAVNRAFKGYENRKAQSDAESHALELSEREKMLDERSGLIEAAEKRGLEEALAIVEEYDCRNEDQVGMAVSLSREIRNRGIKWSWPARDRNGK